METVMYYVFTVLMLGGALGVLFLPNCVGAAMAMLLSMLGAAGMMLLQGAYFPAFVMVSVYAGAVLVLFVFAVMLSGDSEEGFGFKTKAAVLLLWVALGLLLAFFAPQISAWASASRAAADVSQGGALGFVKNYGYAMFANFMLPVQILAAMLLAAMVGVITIAKNSPKPKRKRDLV